jgi:hypothetical protein
MATGRVKRPPTKPLDIRTHALPRIFSNLGIFSDRQIFQP